MDLRLTPGLRFDLFNRGHAVLSSGWEGDIPARDGVETIALPMAKYSDGQSIVSSVLVRFSNMTPGAAHLISDDGSGCGLSRARRPPASTPPRAL